MFFFIPFHSRSFWAILCTVVYLQSRIMLWYTSPPIALITMSLIFEDVLWTWGTWVCVPTLFEDQVPTFTHNWLPICFYNLISLPHVFHVFYPLHGYHSFLLFKRFGICFFFFSIFILLYFHIWKSSSGKFCIYFRIFFFETEFVKVAQDGFELRTIFLQHSQVLSLLVWNTISASSFPSNT